MQTFRLNLAIVVGIAASVCLVAMVWVMAMHVTMPRGFSFPPVYFIAMREPSVRALDTVQTDYHFFDVEGDQAEWNGKTVQLPCANYSGECYTQKFRVLLASLLELKAYNHFYYLESDHQPCVSPTVIAELAHRYSGHFELITTSIGASGWLFTRAWAVKFLEQIAACSEWCYCLDCLAAVMYNQRRATTRVVLSQHVITHKEGLNNNTKPLPRCMQVRHASGLRGFDFFDHGRCANRDLTPCTAHEWQLLK